MKVIYSGPNPLSFHSAPSGGNYVFEPGVPKTVNPVDEEYFTEKCKNIPGNPWKIEGIIETVSKGISAAVRPKRTFGGK